MNKIYSWTLTAYDKICWLDSDMIILKNIDDIFTSDICDGQIKAAHGCTCNIFKNNKLPTHIDRCPFNNLKGTYINTGLILLKPNVATYNLLLNIDYNYPFPDQDAFNEFFKNNIIHIDSKYNYINNLEFAHPEYMPDIHIFHFSYGKPWEEEAMRISDTFKHIYDLWFEYKNLLIY
jgi:lipopolysaccharide biosynthesis glycosyltransferase